MPTYTKLSPADFRKKLKNGGYKDLTGARRAIGKMQEWSEAERDKARNAAAKHFGEEAPAPTKKKAKKKAAKKAAKAKPAKKMPKKRAKKKAAKKPAKASPGPGRGRKKKAAKKTTKASAPKKRASAKSGVDVDARIESTRNAVQAYAEAVDVLKKCQTQQHSVEAGLKSAADGVTQLISAMQTDIVQPLTTAEQRGAELFAQAAPGAVVPGVNPPVVPGNGQGQAAPPAPPTAAPTPPAVTPPPVVPPTTGG
jgi:chemotaxis protein histidine kinase CheA